MNLRETLKSVFDNDYCGAEEFLAKVIVPIFGEEDVDVFDAVESNPTRADEETLKRANIVEIYRVAQVDRIGTDPIEVFDVTLGDNTNISRSRVGIQRIIRSSLFPYSHAFILFHYKILDRTEWRFSYVYKEDKNATTTDAKRYTYLFSRDIHARTAIDRFCKLAESSKDNDALLDAFNVEALSDDFFEKYRAQYAKFVKYITGKEYIKENGEYVEKVTGKPNKELYDTFGRDDKAIRDYVKKMMGRITFLHFLQRKRWLREDVNYMLNLFRGSKYKKDYLDKVLEPLFFGILNTKQENRRNLFESSGWDLDLLDEWKDIPYLNGGLFEQDEVDKYRSVFPAEYFDSLLTFFSEYNFTVDENDPDDAEVGVDPEMLGKIFENLLEDNKDKGAFYTPKEIVRYMCRESLIAYLLEKTGIDESVIRDFVTSPYEKEEQMEWADKEIILTALEDVKICDPAIGSGAFPMGLLNELVRCEEAIVLGQEKNKGRAELKKAIIKNNIYGVDIEKGAIDIARLRFWLSLVVDEEEPSPLPNLDYKIMQGNSLLESYKGMDLSHLLDGQDGLINFGDDTRIKLKEKLDQYYTCEEHIQKKKLQEDINELVHQQIVDSGREVKGFESIDVSANKDFFLWHTWFSDVFTRGDNPEQQTGFDIVIGNPPYINVKRGIDASVKQSYIQEYSLAKGQFDLFTLFIELGYNLLGGVVSMIVPKPLINNENYEACRKLILKKGLSNVVIGSGIFVNASVESCIFISRDCHTTRISEVDDNQHIIDKHSIDTAIFKDLPFAMFNTEITSDSIPVLKQIVKDSVPLGSILSILRGIEAGKKDDCITTKKTKYELLRGQDLARYKITFEGNYCIYDSSDESKFKPLSLYQGKKVMIRRVCNEVMCALDTSSKLCLNTIYCAHCIDSHYSEEYITAILNSSVVQYWFRTMFVLTDKLFPYIRKSQLDLIPIKMATPEIMKAIENRVRLITESRLRDPNSDISVWDNELENYIRNLYGI